MQNIPGIWFPKIFEATKQQKAIAKIDVLNTLDSLTFKSKYTSQSIPFILKNSFTIYSKDEAINTLLSKLPHYKLNVRFGDMSNPSNYINRRTAEMSLAEFVKNHFLNDTNEEIAYAGSCIIADDFLKQLNINYPNFYPKNYFNSPRLWLGRAGTITQLHKDIPDNFALNYFGIKKWIIYPPKDFPFLYMINPNEEELPDFGVSQVNLKKIDCKKFPEFVKAHPLEFITEQGDTLYLPAGWSHYVENTEETLMINFWLNREKSPAILGYDK